MLMSTASDDCYSHSINEFSLHSHILFVVIVVVAVATTVMIVT